MKLTRWTLIYIFLFIFLIFQANIVLANNIVVPYEWYRYQGASDSDDKEHDCGPACVAMAIQFIKDTFVPIRDIRNYIGHPGATTSEELKDSLQHWGISYNHLSAGAQNVIDAVNDRNHIVICPVTMSYFSPGLDIDSESDDDPALHYDRYSSFTGGHFIVVKGISDDGNWIIAYDPNVWGSYPYPKYWYSNGEPKGKERYYKLSEFYNAINSRGIEILPESSTIYVPDDYSTIQAAVDAASSGDTIIVGDGTYDESITFPSGKKVVLKSVNGPSSTTIRGDDYSPTVTLDGSLEDITLEGFTITHADGLTGRGIYIINGNLSIENCNITGNHAYVGDYACGGGIYNQDTLTITASTISDNYADYGGGISNNRRGSMTITGSTICDNSAVDEGGGIKNSPWPSGSLTITTSIISGNTADCGGGIWYSYGSMTITGSTICDNSAVDEGGGIYNDWDSLTITTSIISGNTADCGGGIYNDSYDGTLTITASTILDNSADWGGGIYNDCNGALTITGSTISNNSALYWGGGIYNFYGSMTITTSTISGNSAAGDGGGIENVSGSLTITASTILDNSADWGGGIYNCYDGSLTITASTISSNFAAGDDGGIYLDPTSGTITIGGSNDADKNTICGNYKTGEDPSLDQQIRGDSGSLYETYKNTNYISAYCSIEDQPPTIEITSPSDGETVSGTVRFSSYATDDYGLEKVEFYIDDELKVSHGPFGPDTIGSTCNWDCDTTPGSIAYIPNGNHTFKAKAYDTAGQTAVDNISFIVENQLPKKYEKTMEVIAPDWPPFIPSPWPIFGRMTVSYEWFKQIGGEDVYMISEIRMEAVGFVGFASFEICDTHSGASPKLIWDGNLEPVPIYDVYEVTEKRLVFPDGIEVYASDTMSVRITGWGGCLTTLALEFVSSQGLQGASFFAETRLNFEPDSTEVPPEVPQTPIDVNDLYWAHLASPAELRVYNSTGNVTGLIDGEIRLEISNSVYVDDTVIIFAPPDSYQYQVVGTDEGTYGLGIASIEDGEITTFNATDIPTATGTVHRYTFDWDALSQGGEGVTVQVDSDGDGKFEDTFTSDDELTQDEFLEETSPPLIGDFGSANNGPPDCVVDFEDLMVFALAYGSTPSDPNWNPVCDIAGPDGVIDFEDLMVFAMHYGETCAD